MVMVSNGFGDGLPVERGPMVLSDLRLVFPVGLRMIALQKEFSR